MLTRASFRGFKALAELDLELEPLTVLVGPNASGKSSVLEGLSHVLETAAEGTVDVAKAALYQLRTRPDATEMRLEVQASGGLVFGFVVQPVAGGRIDAKIVTPTGELTQAQWNEDPTSHAALRELASAVRLRFSLEKLMADSVTKSPQPSVADDGEGLASALAYIVGLRDGRIEAIESGLHDVVPIAKRIRCVKAPMKEYKGSQMADRFEIELAGIGWLPPSALSEGTLLALALLTVLHGPARPRMVLLDDLDRALHPKAQAAVIAMIRGVQRAESGVQVICTSHSPYLLDSLEPQEVRVMKVTDNGLALCKKLTDHPDWERWRDSMKPGEFWGSVGEDWIA